MYSFVFVCFSARVCVCAQYLACYVGAAVQTPIFMIGQWVLLIAETALQPLYF